MTASHFNPCEELCYLAEACDCEKVKELIESYGVRGTEPPTINTGKIWLYDIEQALLNIPSHQYDNAIELTRTLLRYKPSKLKISRALHRAIAKSQIRTVRLLLDHGADPNPLGFIHSAYGTPLDEAAAAGDIDAIDALIAAGADISRAIKAVSLAAQNGRTKTLQLLIDIGFPFDLRTLGYDALISNNPSTIDAVRKAGVEFNADYMQDEDVISCPKSLEYLVNLRLQPNQA